MGNLVNRDEQNCRSFLDALEELPLNGGARKNAEEWLVELPEAQEEHAGGCEVCRAALEEFAETRNALAGIAVQEPGPWFATKVMAAINAQEREEEARDGVWISVRRLAPRLVALSALLLALGGSWAFELRKSDGLNAERRKGDLVFDSSVAPASYDEVFGMTNEVRP
jgi:predicted anti-sigma-YlaC factor YlaD